MPTGVVILVTGAVLGIAAAALSISRKTELDPIDPELEKRWLVKKLSKYPRLASFASRRLNPNKAGGLFLTLGMITIVLFAVVVGWVFDMIDNGNGFAQWDMAVAEYGVKNADAREFGLYKFLTHLGGTPVITAVTAIVAAWGWWRYKNFQVGLFMIAVSAGQALVNNGLKWMVDRQRPDLAQLANWAGSSFPSGHSAAAAATYAGVAFVVTLHSGRVPRAIAAGLAFAIAATVAATRALLGVHWLTDVIAGMAVGFSWFVVCAIAFGGRLMKFGETPKRMAEAAQA